MTEAELRLHAIETLLIEWLALEPEGKQLQIEEAVKGGLSEPGEPGYGQDEHNMRLHILGMVQDARQRFDVFGDGHIIERPKPR